MNDQCSGTHAIVDRVMSRVHISPGAGGLSAEQVRQIVAALLPAVQEMIAHERQVQSESSTHNGYVDRLDAGGWR